MRRRAPRRAPPPSPTASTRARARAPRSPAAPRAARFITPPPTTSTSGSHACTIATAPAAQTRRQRSRTAAATASPAAARGEHRLEVDPRRAGERARRRSPAVSRAIAGSAHVEASASTQPTSPARAGPAVEGGHEVAAEAPGLEVLPAQEAALDHRDAADAGAERHHHDVVEAAGGARRALAEQREARVVLDPERQAEGLAAPAGKVERGRVVVLRVRRRARGPRDGSTSPQNPRARPAQSATATPAAEAGARRAPRR